MEISPLILIIWGELTFFLAGGLFLILMNGFIKSRQGKKSVKGLLDKVKADRSRRLEEIKSGLAAYGIEGDDLKQRIAEIDKQELRLYQRISSMYRLRRDSMLCSMNIAVEASTKPYFDLGLILDGASASKETSQDSEIDNSKLEQLLEKNESLQAELSISMDTIGRMLSEYSSMYGSEDEGDLDKSKIMEAFEVDGNSDENLVETDLETLDDEAETDELLEIEDDISDIDDLLNEEAIVDEVVADAETDELQEIDDEFDIDDLLNDEAVVDEVVADAKKDELQEVDDEFDIDDLFNEGAVVDEVVADTETDELQEIDDEFDIDDLLNEGAAVDEPVIDEVIPDDSDLFDEIADDIEVDELDGVVDIETDLGLPSEDKAVETDLDLSDEDDLLEIEGMDEFDIDALIDGGNEKT